MIPTDFDSSNSLGASAGMDTGIDLQEGSFESALPFFEFFGLPVSEAPWSRGAHSACCQLWRLRWLAQPFGSATWATVGIGGGKSNEDHMGSHMGSVLISPFPLGGQWQQEWCDGRAEPKP